jgi:hypothetical protein
MDTILILETTVHFHSYTRFKLCILEEIFKNDTLDTQVTQVYGATLACPALQFPPTIQIIPTTELSIMLLVI